MGFIALSVIAVGLAMDAFAVAVCKGLALKKSRNVYAVITACFFGAFQAIMPLIGYLLGTQFSKYIIPIDHWVAFVLLSIIGIKMIRESRSCDVSSSAAFTLGNLLTLSIATSIDALAVGITFAFLHVNILQAILLIGVITFVLSFLGVKIGNVLGEAAKTKAELFGGIILVAMGLKILIEHLIDHQV